MELEGYSQLTCNKQPQHVGRHRCDLPAWLSMSFVDNIIDLLRQNFISAEFGTKFQREAPLFWRYRIS